MEIDNNDKQAQDQAGDQLEPKLNENQNENQNENEPVMNEDKQQNTEENHQEEEQEQLVEEYKHSQQIVKQNQATISKLRQFNDKCRHELKSLSEALEQQIEKALMKKMTKQKMTSDDYHSEKVEQLKKELKSKELEIQKIKREFQQKKVQDEFMESVHKIQQLENDLTARSREQEEFNKQVKYLEEIQRKHESTIAILNEDFQYKQNIDKLTAELKEYKQQIKKLQKEDLEAEKEQKKQQELLVNIELYFRQEMQIKGLSGNIIKSAVGDDNEIKNSTKPAAKDQKKIPQKYVLDEKDQPFSEESFKECVAKLKHYQKDREELKYENQLQLLQKQHWILEQDMKRSIEKYNQIERDCHITINQLREKARLTKQEPPDIHPKNASFSLEQPLVPKTKPAKVLLQKTKRSGTQRQIEGCLLNNSGIIYDDNQLQQLRDSYDHRIKKIVIYSQFEKIKYVQVYYEQPIKEEPGDEAKENSQEREAVNQGLKEVWSQFDLLDQKQLEKLQQNELVLEQADPIKYISGFYTDQIDYLKIETQSGKSIGVGKIVFSQTSQEFRIELKTQNIPLGFMAVYTRKEDPRNPAGPVDVSLLAIGVEYKIPFDPLRLPDYMKMKKKGANDEEIKEDIRVQEQDPLLEKEKRLHKLLDSRKTYKNYNRPSKLAHLNQSDKNLLLNISENTSLKIEKREQSVDKSKRNMSLQGKTDHLINKIAPRQHKK